MNFGLYVYGESNPRFSGNNPSRLRAQVEQLSPAERERGWTIKPLAPQWPTYPPPDMNSTRRFWIAAGVSVLLFLLFIVVMSFR